MGYWRRHSLVQGNVEHRKAELGERAVDIAADRRRRAAAP
jgi:hypothetical protein